ncbi:MAG: methyltransferase, FxLD system [Chloroflexota bacterium]|nr:methyltransferase, FxLD system [Chloroflexota bacterium]
MGGRRGERVQAGDSDDARTRHHALVQRLKDRAFLSDPRVEAAFRAVPRHLFLPEVPLETVYKDEAIATKKRDGLAISSSSQPAVMAIMLEQLGLQRGDHVLEIGAGTGYNAALMAHIVGPKGHVIAVDLDQDIVENAHAHLTAAGCTDVQVVCGDGVLGYPEAAPYDRIILTVGAWDIAAAWVEQLRPGGRLVLPLALNGTVQKLVAFERRDDHLVSVSVQDGAFMPLRGIDAVPRVHFPLGGGRDLLLGVGAPRPIDADTVYTLLTGPYEDLPTQLRATAGELWAGVSLWLALHAPTMCSMVATGDAAARAAIPSPLSASPGYRVTVGLLEEVGLCLLARSPDDGPPSAEAPFGLAIRTFNAGHESAQHLVDLLHSWEEAGRPSSRGLRITAYTKEPLSTTAPSALIIHKPRTRLVLAWEGVDRSVEC